MNTVSDVHNSEAEMSKVLDTTGGGIPRDPVRVSRKHSPTVVLAALLPLALIFGVDRMYTGRVKLGILKLITLGGLDIWGIVDLILIGSGKARDGNGNPLIAYDDGTPPDSRPGEGPPESASVSHKHFAAVVLSVLLGWLGIDRMYIGRVGLGILKLITLGGLGVWALVDLILIGTGKAIDGNGNPLIAYS